ncbi:MAG TPA: YicC/YloC family endoribonuclease [Gammaproteobacteria bacterium]|nr:YicC/YloC family endoribonuclease [Gammaproteobacteria bacterium]
MRSMTGFALARRQGEMGEFVLELRAVNHRYLDLKINLPDRLRALENPMREQFRAALARGRVEALLRWRAPQGAGLQVNESLARELVEAARKVASGSGADMPIASDALRLLAWPGVAEPPLVEVDSLEPVVSALVKEALDSLVAVREREGAALASALTERLDRVEAAVSEIREHLPEARKLLSDRLADRLAGLGAEVDAARVAQEAAMLVVRQDVDEELDRLAAHVKEVRRLLGQNRPVGRRLDFLMQELGREAGTLASKASDLEINRRALDCRVLVEEMREQVQNIE